jgi:hypothetical protein
MTRPLGYTIVSEAVTGGHRRKAVFTCSCGATFSQPLANKAVVTNPELVTRKAAAAGWRVHHFRASMTKCPACINTNRAGERPEKRTPPVTDQPVAQKNVRPATHEERFKIRAALDQHFDDKAGRYLGGFSDRRIGEELNIPWALVEQIREVGYGPIKEDPEISALRTEIEKLVTSGAALLAEAVRLDRDAGQLRTRLAAVEKSASARR